MTPRCSLIIRCCNESRHIERLLAGVMAQSVREVEIILVDSGSTDATLEIARRYPVTVLTIPRESFSFGRALNLGCRAARGEFLVMVSAHAHPMAADWLEQLLAPFADPRVALVYGRQRGDGRTRFSEHRVFAQWFPEQSIANQPHAFCNNANAAIRRALWQRFPYDEGLTGLEDLDWGQRARDAGWAIAYQAAAGVIHIHEESWGQLRQRYRREAIALLHIMPEKRFATLALPRLFVGSVLGDLLEARRQGVLARELVGIVAFRFMQLAGTWQGFNQRGPVSAALKRVFYYPEGAGRGARGVGADWQEPRGEN